MCLSLLRYVLVFLILVSFQKGLKAEEVKGDSSQIRGFIGSKKVAASELKRISNSLRDIIALDKGKEKAEQSSSHLEEEAWLQLALLQEAQQQGIQVSEQEVDKFLHNNQRFQVDHRFDPSRYETILSHLEIDPRRFRQTVKDWLLIDKLLIRIRRRVTITEQELKEAFEQTYELRKADYVIFPLRRYMSPEAVSSLLQGAPGVKLQEELTRAEEKSVAEAERYHELTQQLLKEEKLTFQEAARTLGLEVHETGYFSRNVPPTDIQQPDWMWSEAFLITKGELSQVVAVRDGYLFFTISEIFPPTDKQYSRARENFLLSYRKHKEEQLIEEYQRKLLNTVRILEPRAHTPMR